MRTRLRILGPDGERASTDLPSVRGSADEEVALDLDAGDDVAYLFVIRSRPGPLVPDGSACSTQSELALMRLSASGRLRVEGTRVPRTRSGTQDDGACVADAGEQLGARPPSFGYPRTCTPARCSACGCPATDARVTDHRGPGSWRGLQGGRLTSSCTYYLTARAVR